MEETVLVYNNKADNLEKILLQVQKPARYSGGELNSVVKKADEVDVRFAFCFPDIAALALLPSFWS